jgi:hypothetical protein
VVHSKALRWSARSSLSWRLGGGMRPSSRQRRTKIKIVTGALPFYWGSKVESALRIFGADRALLLIEGVAIAKIIMLGIALLFRRRRR